MGIISDALKKAGQERRRRPGRRERFGHDEPIVDLPTFGGLLGEDAEGAGSGEDRARAIMAGMPGLDERVVAVYQSEGVEAEQFRSLRTRLLNQNPDNEHRIIAVTSSTPREGKSITTINLAFALSEVKLLVGNAERLAATWPGRHDPQRCGAGPGFVPDAGDQPVLPAPGQHRGRERRRDSEFGRGPQRFR